MVHQTSAPALQPPRMRVEGHETQAKSERARTLPLARDFGDALRNFRMLQAVLAMHEAATAAFCSQDESAASALTLKNHNKTMHLYQRFAVKWMVAREQGRGRPLAVPAAPAAPAPAATSPAAAATVHLYRPRTGDAAAAPLRLMKIEAAAAEPCIVSAYADALQRLAPSDFVNINSSSSSSSSVHRNPMWQRLPPELSCSCTPYYCNPCTGEVRAANLDDQRDADFSPFGGLLCDQMGIGKVGAVCTSRFVVAVRLLIAACSIPHFCVFHRRCSALP